MPEGTTVSERGFCAKRHTFPAGVVESSGWPQLIVSIHAGAPVRATCVRDGRSTTSVVRSGDIEIIPPGEPGRWEDESPAEAVVMRFDRTFIAGVAAGLDIDPDIEIRPQSQIRDDVIAAIGAQNLVDVRSPDEFSGKLLAPAHLPQEQSQRPGHVPTARNIPWSKNANDDGTFKSDDELKELYAEENVDLARDTIAYCRIGERSALTWFVLHELLGVENVKNYDGSWTEYGSVIGVPIENPAKERQPVSA